MSFFTKKKEIESCVKCGVYFKARGWDDNFLKNFCSFHREDAVKEKEKERVLAWWIKEHAEEIYPKAKEEYDAERNINKNLFMSMINNSDLSR